MKLFLRGPYAPLGSAWSVARGAAAAPHLPATIRPLMCSAGDLRLSVVIPTFNTAELTLRCVLSVCETVAPDTEVIVVDDGGSDNTPQRLDELGERVRLIRHPHQQGFSAAANTGLGQARGDLLLLLNSDTEIPAGSLTPVHRAFCSDPRLGIGGAELVYPDGTPQWSGGRRPTLRWLFALTSGLPSVLRRLPGYARATPAHDRPVDWVSGAAMVLRRSVWQSTGPFDLRFRFYCQDLDLCLRATAKNWKVTIVPGFRVIHHHGATIGKDRIEPHQAPELLWSDLLLWAAKACAPSRTARAARIMRLGAALRLAARRAATPFVRRDRRSEWRRATASIRAAREALAAATDHVTHDA